MFTSKKAAAAIIALFTVGSIGLAGCSSSTPTPAPAPAQTAPAPAPAPAPMVMKGVNLYLTILDGGQIDKEGWPTYLPGNMTVPADTDVTVTIRNFDDGPADIPAEDGKLVGTLGNNMKVYPQTTGPLDEAKAQTVSELDVKNVGHTFTINDNGLNLNVPVPPSSTVVFTFHTPKAGTYAFRCMSACGTGTSGTEGTMATDGWMRGVLTVQ